ncbi:MAG: hypothetical protein JXI33_00215 [Candidatus Aminicenantes bacterium]|nr:hypothetical protein [Candidatus Aminicenantes bacterium]
MSRVFGSTVKNVMLEKISHALVGLTLVLKGIDKAEHFNDHSLTVVFLFVAGAFIILGGAFHHHLEKKIPNFTALFHVAEGIALILIGFALLKKSSRMPYFLFFIGVVYLGLGAFGFFIDADKKKKLRPLLLTVMGIVFLLAALVAFTLNYLGSGNSWAYFTAGLIFVMGLFILFVRKRKMG